MAERQSGWCVERRAAAVDETKRYRENIKKLTALTILVVGAAAAYLLIDSKMYNPKLFQFVMKLRIPTLAVMLIAAFAIGGASIVF